jgi:hypothetical protein
MSRREDAVGLATPLGGLKMFIYVPCRYIDMYSLVEVGYGATTEFANTWTLMMTHISSRFALLKT